MKYEKCPECNGSGVTLNTYNGEPNMCGYCKGNTVIPMRDAKGRFVK